MPKDIDELMDEMCTAHVWFEANDGYGDNQAYRECRAKLKSARDAISAALSVTPKVSLKRLHFELSGWKRGLKVEELRRSLEAAGCEVME